MSTQNGALTNGSKYAAYEQPDYARPTQSSAGKSPTRQFGQRNAKNISANKSPRRKPYKSGLKGQGGNMMRNSLMNPIKPTTKKIDLT